MKGFNSTLFPSTESARRFIVSLLAISIKLITVHHFLGLQKPVVQAPAFSIHSYFTWNTAGQEKNNTSSPSLSRNLTILGSIQKRLQSLKHC